MKLIWIFIWKFSFFGGKIYSIYEKACFRNASLRQHCVRMMGLWAATSENVPSNICAQRRLKSACASAQSDLSLQCPHEETLYLWLSKLRPMKILYRLREWMHRLIWILAGCAGTFSDINILMNCCFEIFTTILFLKFVQSILLTWWCVWIWWMSGKQPWKASDLVYTVCLCLYFRILRINISMLHPIAFLQLFW